MQKTLIEMKLLFLDLWLSLRPQISSYQQSGQRRRPHMPGYLPRSPFVCNMLHRNTRFAISKGTIGQFVLCPLEIISPPDGQQIYAFTSFCILFFDLILTPLKPGRLLITVSHQPCRFPRTRFPQEMNSARSSLLKCPYFMRVYHRKLIDFKEYMIS